MPDIAHEWQCLCSRLRWDLEPSLGHTERMPTQAEMAKTKNKQMQNCQAPLQSRHEVPVEG